MSFKIKLYIDGKPIFKENDDSLPKLLNKLKSFTKIKVR